MYVTLFHMLVETVIETDCKKLFTFSNKHFTKIEMAKSDLEN